MATDNLGKLIELITGPWKGRIEVVKRLLDNLDLRAEDERTIAQLYLSLTPKEQSLVRQVLQLFDQARKEPNLTSISSKPGDAGEADRIIVSDVHRNEQVNIVALSHGLQTILCSDLTHGVYYALWPMVGDVTNLN